MPIRESSFEIRLEFCSATRHVPRSIGSLRGEQEVGTALESARGRRQYARFNQGGECHSSGIGIAVQFVTLRPPPIGPLTLQYGLGESGELIVPGTGRGGAP